MGRTSVTDATAVTRLAERGFGDGYRRPPQVVWSAPGRANLIGEHTDYNDGFVLPFAIAERTAVAAAGRDDGVVTVASTFAPGSVSVALADIAPGGGYGWAGYPLGVAWALRTGSRPAGRGRRRPVHPLRRAGRRRAVLLGRAGDGGRGRARRPVGAVA